jgi:hypothetical protein
MLVDLGFVPAAKATEFEPWRDQQGVGIPEDLAAACRILGGDRIGINTAARERRGGRVSLAHDHN